MINVKILSNGNLKLSASNECRRWIKENSAIGYWAMMAELFENYSCNGGFVHFDASNGNPFIGLTSAPAIAEGMNFNDEGVQTIEGRAWAFIGYELRDECEELKNKGFVIYTQVV